MTYKLLSYQAGRDARAGVLSAMPCTTRRSSRAIPPIRPCSESSRLEQGEPAAGAGGEPIAARKSRAKGVPLERVKLRAPVLYPGNIYCAGANYTDHMAEMARARASNPDRR